MKQDPTRLLLSSLAAASLHGTASADLIHHWEFDEGSGAVAADSAGSNDGTISGATWGSDATRSSYLIFNGADNYVDPNLTLPTMDTENDFTWAVWVNSQEIINPSSGGQRNAIIIGNRKDGFGVDFTPREFIKLTPRRFEWRPLDSTDVIDYPDVQLENWVHLAIVKDGDNIQAYYNGIPEGVDIVENAFTNLMPFFIGGEPGQGAAEHFNGFIDDVRLYDNALTQEEVQALLGGGALLPFWDSEPLVLPSISVGEPIVGDLNDFVSNPRDGALTFAKVSGPDWLIVDPNGTLSGTPTASDTGDLEFMISATNTDGPATNTVLFAVFDPNAPLPNDALFGWWPLNDGSGSVAIDVSGNGRDAVITNETTGGLGGGSVWLEDPECGTVLTFSGDDTTGAYAEVGGLLPLFTLDPENDFTWSFWAKGTDEPINGDIILGNRRMADDNNFDPREFIKFTGNAVQWDYNTTQRISYGAINAALGWAHHVMVKDGDQLSYYRNGALNSNITLNNAPANPQPLFFGGQGFGERWVGSLFDVRLFNAALTSSEIIALNDQKGQFPSNFGPSLKVSTSGSDLVFEWDSIEGKVYNLRNNTDLVGPTTGWPIFGDNMDIAATPPTNTLTVARPADPRQFFVLEEFNPPPAVVFSDNFENGVGNWQTASTDEPGTDWELGTPSNVGPPAANGGSGNCFGTNISADYTDDALVTLRSELIDLQAASGATLKFSHYIVGDPDGSSSTPFDIATVRVLDSADQVLDVVTVLGNEVSEDWTDITQVLPASALGQMVKLEFEFDSDDTINGPGWYVDDVQVIVP